MADEAVSRRPPGSLPDLQKWAAQMEQAVRNAPVGMRGALEPIAESVRNIARAQDAFNRRVFAGYNSLPALHGSSHKGGLDNIAGSADPTAITFGADGDPGTPQSGFAPIDHAHDTTALDSLEGLTGLSTDDADGAAVYDVNARRLLEHILVQVLALQENLMLLLEEEEGGGGVGDVTVALNGTAVGTRARINLIEGTDVNLTVADDSANDEIDVTIESTATGGYTEGCRVYHSAVLTIANTTSTALAFDSERYDTDTMHDTVTNNTRITFTTAGKYICGAAIRWTSANSQSSQCGIRKNGTTYLGVDEYYGGGISGIGHVVSLVDSFAAGDYIEAIVYQNSGAPLDLEAVGNRSPEAWAQRIG